MVSCIHKYQSTLKKLAQKFSICLCSALQILSKALCNHYRCPQNASAAQQYPRHTHTVGRRSMDGIQSSFPFYTWVERGNNGKVPCLRAQHVGGSRTRTHELRSWDPSLSTVPHAPTPMMPSSFICQARMVSSNTEVTVVKGKLQT